MIDDNNFGVTVRDELPLNEFLNYEAENEDKISFNETVHIFPNRQEGEIDIYRLVGDTDNGNYDRIRTTIENVTFTVKSFNSELSGEIRNWCFQAGDGETVLTLLAAMKTERSDVNTSITYYEQNNFPALEDTGIDNETFILEYETETHRNNMVKINNAHHAHSVKNANFK